jgi:hypothetical protein
LSLTVADKNDPADDTVTAISDGTPENLYVAEDIATQSATVEISTAVALPNNGPYPGPGGSISLTVARSDGWTDYIDPAQSGMSFEMTLPVTMSGACDFIVQVSTDTGDQRVIDVHVVKPWTAVGAWATGQAALVTANVNGASLAELAQDITGNAADASLLSNVGTITRDKQIDVTPLLTELASRVRDQVVIAAQNPNLSQQLIGFGATPNPAGYYLSQMKAPQINSLFNGTEPVLSDPNGGLAPAVHYNCEGMAEIIFVRGLIQGASLTDAEFDELKINVADIQSSYCVERSIANNNSVPLQSLQPGYWALFMNAPNCPVQIWQAENVIVTGADTYFGWPYGQQSYAWWQAELKRQFNKGVPLALFEQGLWTTRNIGYKGTSWFLNIPKLGQMIFNMRTNQTP